VLSQTSNQQWQCCQYKKLKADATIFKLVIWHKISNQKINWYVLDFLEYEHDGIILCG
jgi:hypothetical protein